jgi:hypothetical protein
MVIRCVSICAVFICSCQSNLPKVTLFKTEDLVIADTANKPDQFLRFDDYSDYPIYYIGSRTDTIKIGKRYWPGRTQWCDDFETPCSRSFSENTLRIAVDTSIKTNSPVEYFSESPKAVTDSTINYNSFLFSISNISDSTVFMGLTFSVFLMHREAKDKNGKWVKIDKKLSESDFCRTGEPRIILRPNEIMISKVKRYKGPYVTDFRLAFGINKNIVYSNVFRDSMDERTFRNLTTND